MAYHNSNPACQLPAVMPDGNLSSVRVERAIYLVGGLVIGLLGFQALVSVLLSLYDTFVPGPAPGPGSHFWVDVGVSAFVSVVFVLVGLSLLYLAWRSHTAAREQIKAA